MSIGNTYIYLESFASAVFLWVFLTLSLATAILLLRTIEMIATSIYHHFRDDSEMDKTLARLNSYLDSVEGPLDD